MSRKHNKKNEVLDFEIDIEQLMLHSRNIFLSEPVTAASSLQVNKELLALDSINNKPIHLFINSTGGSIFSGFSIIDTMQLVNSPVYTIINGGAFSMATVIAMNGTKRFMTENSLWMLHQAQDSSENFEDMNKLMIRATEFWEKAKQRLSAHVTEHTKLPPKLREQGLEKELWLDATQCLNYGIVDSILKGYCK